MINQTTSPAVPVGLEKENQVEIRAATGWTRKNNLIVSRRRIVKWSGAISSVLLSAVALAPNIFRIPASLQPWVFLTAIFWVLAFCAGMFDL